MKASKIISVLIIAVIVLSIGSISFAKMAEDEENSEIMLDSTETVPELPIKKQTVDYKLIIGITIIVIVVVLIIGLFIIKTIKRKNK